MTIAIYASYLEIKYPRRYKYDSEIFIGNMHFHQIHRLSYYFILHCLPFISKHRSLLDCNIIRLKNILNITN